ncbi:MAG: sensor histidine kinase [Niabella sp.]
MKQSVFNRLDHDLAHEAHKHSNEIKTSGDSLFFMNKAEWMEREHNELQLNPVFIQLIDKDGRLMDKSPNLKGDRLRRKKKIHGGHYNAYLKKTAIRQAQLPIEKNGKVIGYIQAAMSSESALAILTTLKNVLLISYLIVLIGLYFISRFLAGRSIKPVQNITDTIKTISGDSLEKRVILPPNKDELFDLATGFNALLNRIEKALEREKQFTSDASHELRTPLATLRGTLEVLIRKPRTQQEYENKINISLQVIERMSVIVEQLLLLARLDANEPFRDSNLMALPAIIDESLTRQKNAITAKNLDVDFYFNENAPLLVPHFYSSLIIDNVISNAVKYAKNNTLISITINQTTDGYLCTIKDNGIGIKAEELKYLYDNFFRSDSLQHKHIPGNGLGLSIAKKCANAINATIDIESCLDEGTIVHIHFKKINKY